MNIMHQRSLIALRKASFLFIMLIGQLGFATSLAFAEGEMTFKGTLIEPPPCKVDDSQPIEVNFGDQLGVNTIDGVAHAKPLIYQLNCQDTSSKRWKLILSLDGEASPFNENAFKTNSLTTNKTNENNLGILIYQENGTAFKPNSQLEITDAQNPPKLMAVPVKRPGSALIEGGFETLVTLLAQYQ